jgi:hypothetical protein
VRVHSRLAGPAEPLKDKFNEAVAPAATALTDRFKETACAEARDFPANPIINK